MCPFERSIRVRLVRPLTILRLMLCATLCAGVSLPAPAKEAPNLKPRRVAIAYVPPTNPAHEELYARFKEARVLERFKAYLSPMRLPATLTLRMSDCDGESNAWYEPDDHAVTVCYEYVADVMRNLPESVSTTGVTRDEAMTGPIIEVFLHEIGHALFDLLHIPILGREEDAADQLAAYMMLQMDREVARHTIRGVAYMYNNEMRAQTPGLAQFANVHSLSGQRFYNLVCIGYGADTEYFADVVKKGYLPESRAEGCEDEYKQVDYAYRKLIGPYVDRSVRRKIKPEQHLTPDVYK